MRNRTILTTLCEMIIAGGLVFSLISPVDAGNKETQYYPFFGDLHTHTRFSDGWEGTPADAYASALAGGADFMATVDHMYMLTPEEWEATLSAAQAYTSEDFVAMPAYEYWMPGFGEVAVYNVPYFPSEHINLQ